MECFDSVAENLLENERRLKSDVSIGVELVASDDDLRLRACDMNDAVAQEITASFFQRPIQNSA